MTTNFEATLSPSFTKPPRLVFTSDENGQSHAVHAFSPNRATLGGTAYLIVSDANILVDCPAWDATTHDFLAAQGGVDWLFLTQRGAIAQAKAIQKRFNCKVAIQEQEAYLLPGLPLVTFREKLQLTETVHALWTPGFSPGSACLYCKAFGGVLFTGRHLLPTPNAAVALVKTAKTFHWLRQKRSLDQLIAEFNPETLQFLCPGGNIGFLRGQAYIGQAYAQLLTARMADAAE